MVCHAMRNDINQGRPGACRRLGPFRLGPGAELSSERRPTRRRREGADQDHRRGDPEIRGLLVDVREPGEYADGYIPGAVNLPRGVIELKIWPYVGFPDKTDLSRKITLYCGTGLHTQEGLGQTRRAEHAKQ